MATKKLDVLAELGTDAAKWTEALAAMLMTAHPDDVPFDDKPGSDLFGWVANMIEAGRSAGYAKGQEDLSSAVEFHQAFSGKFTEVAAPGKNDPTPSADNLAEWLRVSVDHPLRMTPDAVSYYVNAIHDAGRDATRKEGLNTDDDVPVLTLADVNAIEFSLDYGGRAVLTVDGNVRALLGKPNTVILTTERKGEDQQRYVLLRDGEALETPPNRVDGE